MRASSLPPSWITGKVYFQKLYLVLYFKFWPVIRQEKNYLSLPSLFHNTLSDLMEYSPDLIGPPNLNRGPTGHGPALVVGGNLLQSRGGEGQAQDKDGNGKSLPHM